MSSQPKPPSPSTYGTRKGPYEELGEVLGVTPEVAKERFWEWFYGDRKYQPKITAAMRDTAATLAESSSRWGR